MPAKRHTEEDLPAVLSGGSVPDFIRQSLASDAGKGVSTAAEDNIVPLIYILQSNSPQVKPRDPDYIDGAVDGNIWLRSSGLPTIDGDTGIVVQPCYFFRQFVEWRLPRGQGMAGVHDHMPSDAVETPNPENPKKMIWLRPNGNQIVDTRNHVVRVFLENGPKMSYSIPLSSTGHTVSRSWTTLMNMKQMDGQRAPSWACLYRLKTKQRSKDGNTWNVFDVSDAGWVQTADDYNAGKALHEAFASGAKVTETPAEDHETPSNDSVM